MSKTPDPSVVAMRRLCEDVNAAISRGDLPADTMADFKAVVDDARLRLWASMESAQSGDPAWAQEFWLQRAADMCKAASQLLERGELERHSPRAGQLHAAVDHLATLLRPGPPTG